MKTDELLLAAHVLTLCRELRSWHGQKELRALQADPAGAMGVPLNFLDEYNAEHALVEFVPEAMARLEEVRVEMAQHVIKTAPQ
ncbi:hypothetical protein LJR118_000593 [Acidovorax sp. LjRoot118]|uniref:hypothetical protein n=1 Tax=Acidovorax sp. LjRoot118 TaxID=3342256 RepID=UPI003ED13791